MQLLLHNKGTLVLYRKSECSEESMKGITIACTVLYNLCIEYDKDFPVHFDLTKHNNSMERQDREAVCELLKMHMCTKVRDSSVQASQIRTALKEKVWNKKQAQAVY